ncbi:MAG TPA: class I SAM-dependent methyltransferase [Vicinamibacterales bacterium]
MLRWPFAKWRTAVSERIDPQTAYSLWAASYDPRPHNRLMELEQVTLLALIPDVSALTVLDAGCGTGRYLRELEARGANAIGIDLSAPMLDRARRENRRLACADFRALPFGPMTVDLVVCSLALGDVADLEVAVGEIARVLRPSGRAIYSVVHPAGAAAGWSRTFERDGRQWAIDGYWHSLDRHREACATAGLSIEEWREPVLAEKPGQPALLVVRASR